MGIKQKRTDWVVDENNFHLLIGGQIILVC